MIAMQYNILLADDYPMEKIEQRIRDKGHLLDHFPGLVFKAYLYSRKDAAHGRADNNRYAPFYVWKNHHAMMRFLSSDGFQALCEQFGRPNVTTWFIDTPITIPESTHAFASLCVVESDKAASQATSGLPYNYQTWQQLDIRWLNDLPQDAEGNLYDIGYIAYG